MTATERDAFVDAVWQRCGPQVPAFIRRMVDPQQYLAEHRDREEDEKEDKRDFRRAVGKFMREDWPRILQFALEAVARGRVDAPGTPPGPRLTDPLFQRRLRRFALVAEQVVPAPALLRGDFGARSRPTNWQSVRREVVARSGPHTHGEVLDLPDHRDALRVWWSRNRGDAELQNAYLNQLLSDLASMVTPPEGEEPPLYIRLVRALVMSGAARQVSVRSERLQGHGIVTLQAIWEAVHGTSQ